VFSHPRSISLMEELRFPVHTLVQVARKESLAHRSRMDIIANILNVANTGARKTHIMYKCNLSFKQLRVYLEFLRERKLLKSIPLKTQEKNNSVTYQTTNKGKAFLQAYSSIRALLSSSEFKN